MPDLRSEEEMQESVSEQVGRKEETHRGEWHCKGHSTQGACRTQAWCPGKGDELNVAASLDERQRGDYK